LYKYDSKIPLTNALANDAIQLFLKLTNIEQISYKYASVMQQINSSSCGLFTIAYATNITFGIDPENSSIFYHKCNYNFKIMYTINFFFLSQNTQNKTPTLILPN
jgi:hypothetical protein